MSHPRVHCELSQATTPSPRDSKLALLTLSTFRGIADLTRQKVRLAEGMTLSLYEEKGPEEDRELEGTALFRPHRRGLLFKSWFIEADLSRIRTVPGIRKEYEVRQPCWGCGRDLTPQLEEGAKPEHDRVCVGCRTRMHEPFGDSHFAEKLQYTYSDQECTIPCVECTILSPGLTPCPACGEARVTHQSAQMCNAAIQKTYGEESRSAYLEFQDALRKHPEDPDTLKRFRDWIRGAVSYSMMYPAWSAAFKNVPFVESSDAVQALNNEVLSALKREFHDAGRRLGGSDQASS